MERARRKRPERLDAYDLYLRALPHAYANKPTDTDEALRLLGEAERLEALGIGIEALRLGHHLVQRRSGLAGPHLGLGIARFGSRARIARHVG